MSKEISSVFGSQEARDKIPSIITNPFLGKCIVGIMMRSYRIYHKEDFKTYAEVEFKNGSTSGEQRIEATNLPELLMKVYEFCQSLENG